jgi:hypothetical protein
MNCHDKRKYARSITKESDEVIKLADDIHKKKSRDAENEFCDERIRAGSDWDMDINLVRTNAYDKRRSALKNAYDEFVNTLKVSDNVYL